MVGIAKAELDQILEVCVLSLDCFVMVIDQALSCFLMATDSHHGFPSIAG